jgi:hypothetical protein
MTTNDFEILEVTFREASAAVLKPFQALVHKEWPNAVARISASTRGQKSSATLSVLHRQDGDGVDLQLALSRIDDAIWYELVLFLGQSTLVTLDCKTTNSPPTEAEELKSIVRDSAIFIEPRLLDAVRLAASS